MPSDDMATDPIPSESMQDHDASRPPSSAENPESDLDDDKRYLIHVAPARKRYISERKKLDSAAFQDWVATNDVKVQRTKAIGTEPSKSVVAESAATEHWKDKIIASPREYQLELFERAKMKNTIIVLDTGKTFSAKGLYVADGQVRGKLSSPRSSSGTPSTRNSSAATKAPSPGSQSSLWRRSPCASSSMPSCRQTSSTPSLGSSARSIPP